ncbi:hypothetical protein [Desulfospira joergensenii]|uniref:hypothetical protein n=1 Tax=Desulfospira joergensenii TaxID=53329 RepID=UPI0003B3AC1A|nr:hypothetical protein [Desulfospira joergensenii]
MNELTEILTCSAADDYARAKEKKKPEIKKFEVSKTYGTRSICDHNCIFKFTIIRRTDKSVWIQRPGETKIERRKIDIWDGAENIFPHGKYSMAAILRATDPTY